MRAALKFRAAAILAALSFFSCKSMAVNGVSTALSGADKKGTPTKKKPSANNPLTAITGETDVTLVGGFFPTVLEMYELLHAANPAHKGLAVMAGSLNVMYANAFVQAPAANLPSDQFDAQNDEYMRAKAHYLRGRDYCLDALDSRHKGFAAAVLGTNEDAMRKAVAELDKDDVNAAYWAGAGWLGAFSLDLLDPNLLGSLSSPPAILERAAALDPDYSGGAIWDVLSAFYISAGEFGGSEERALYCHEQAVRASGGKSPGPYVTYAESFCVPKNDRAGFVEALGKALAINPDDDPPSRLMTTISQKKAKRLLERVNDYFLEW